VPLRSIPWPGPVPREVLVTEGNRGPALLMLPGDGGLEVFSAEFGALEPTPTVPFPISAMRANGVPDAPLTLLGDSQFAWGKWNVLTVEAIDAGRLLDVSINPEGVLLTTTTGVWTRPYEKPDRPQPAWVPAFGNLEPGEVQFAQVMRDGSNVVLFAVTTDGGTTLVKQYTEATPPLPAYTFSFNGRDYAGPEARPLEAAVARPLALVGTPASLAVGGLTAAGTPVIAWATGSVAFEALNGTEQSRLAALDERGRLWRASPWLVAMTPAGPPSVVFGDAFVTQEPPDKRPEVFGPAGDLACFAQRAASWCQATPFLPRPTSATRGITGWVGTVEPPVMNEVTTFPASVRVDLAGPPLAKQVLSSSIDRYVSAARVRDGGTLLVTGAFDYVSWAEVSDDVVELRVAVSPLPRGEITDLVLTDRPPPASEANFAEGWLVASGRVFRIFASTRALWRSSEVVLPTEVEVVRVWLDGPRPRAGDRNGVVFSLDSVVALSEPVPGNGQAIDYAHFCNNDFVLAGGQLYRLVASSSVLGRWEPVPAPAALERLSDVGGELRVWDAEGTAYWLDGLTCAP
jgi:hypothetical protein